jgi:DNA-binding PucR family transcriptional regulator
LLGRLGRSDETIAVDELGVLGLFLDSQHPEQLGALAEHVLGPAIAHDQRAAGSLVETLDAYLDSGCNARACAEQLYVHVNTVKYRIRRLEELCGLDLRLPDDLLRATMARISLKVLGPPARDTAPTGIGRS